MGRSVADHLRELPAGDALRHLIADANAKGPTRTA